MPELTQEEYNELMELLEDQGRIKFLLQAINDTLECRILPYNIHNNAIEERHIRPQAVTTEKLEVRGIALFTVAKDFNWSTLGDDGNKPADDADVTADSTFVTVTYPADQSDVQDQIDGKIVSWFTDTDPSGTWEGTDASHEGDVWWNTSTKKLKRYDGSAWSADIEDQKAIDAYTNAATAQDTADGKRRVFTAEPTTPYDIGDLWSAGPTGELKKCKVARATGDYQAGDWELASKYTDDTTADAKAKVFRQATEPSSGMVAGDIWFDTDDGNKPYIYDGADWIVAYTLIDGGYIRTGTITADKYEELRNTYVFNGDDSLDGDFPFELDFEIVSEMTSIESVKLSFRISQFRAYAKAGVAQGTPSGGGSVPTSSEVETPIGGTHTSGAGGATVPTSDIPSGYNSYNLAYNWTVHNGGFLAASYSGIQIVHVTHTHTVTIPNHYHIVYNHTHPIHAHTVTIPDHTHPDHTHTAVYGIFEDSTSPTIHYHIDNGAGYGGASGNFTTDQLDIDITGLISGTGFKRIKFESTTRARIRAWVLCKIDLSA